MKMRDVANIIKKNMDFDLNITGISFLISPEAKEKISALLNLPYFNKFTNIKDLILTNPGTKYNRNYKELEDVLNELLILKKTCNLFVDSFEEFYPDISKTSFSLKFRETNDLEIIANTILSLNKALNQMFSGTYLDSSYQLSNFDQGSKWIDVIIEKKGAFTCFATTLTFVTTIAFTIQEIRLKELEIQKMKIEIQKSLENTDLKKIELDRKKTELEMLEKTSKASAELDEFLINKKIESKVTELIDNYYNSDSDFELPNRLKFAINELIKLQTEENIFRPTDLITYNIPNEDINPWGYIQDTEKKKIEYKKEEK